MFERVTLGLLKSYLGNQVISDSARLDIWEMHHMRLLQKLYGYFAGFDILDRSTPVV